MTIQQAIDWVDEKKHNVFSREDKLFWMERLEQTAKEFVDQYEGSEGWLPADFDPDADYRQNLMIPPPFDAVYLRWMECQMDYASQEYRKYNNSKAMFEAEWRAFTGSFNRTHRYLGKPMKYV